LHFSGKKRLRVTTVSARYGAVADVAVGFDQEASAALMARLAVSKTDSEETLGELD
jgi:protein transport protein SEC23